MKNSDIAAFILLFGASVFLLFLIAYFWIDAIGWQKLWILGIFLVGITLLLGYLFAKYAFSPLIERNEELDRMLKDTLHELNIPVATIKANVAMMKKNLKDEKDKKRAFRIEAAAQQLLDLYKEVDYLIKREIHKEEKEIVDLGELVCERVKFFDDLLGTRSVKCDIEPMKIEISKIGFIKTFDNILSNAIKYSPDGSLIQIIAKDSHLVVKDEGIGIEEADLVKIFDRYYRANREKKGYGIGLNIVKEFCDENQIPISLYSQKGKGTQIILDLTKVKV